MSGSPKMTNRLPVPVFARSSAMCRSAFMRALSTGSAPSLLNSVACGSKLNAHAISTSKPASAASLAPRTSSCLATVPNSGPTRIPARRSGPSSPSVYRPCAQISSPGHGSTEENVIRSALCACWTPVVARCPRIIAAKSSAVPYAGCPVGDPVDQLVVLVDGQEAVR